MSREYRKLPPIHEALHGETNSPFNTVGTVQRIVLRMCILMHTDIILFLLGVCFQGGSGWWKYEFCYGKQVTQFHQEVGNVFDTN